MDIKQQIQEHTFLVYKLAYEKVKLLVRIEVIDKEVIHYEGVINAFELAVKIENNKHSNVHDNERAETGRDPEESAD